MTSLPTGTATLLAAPPTAPTLTVSPSSVAGGAFVTVSWTTIARASARDWIGLYRLGDPDTAYLDYRRVNCLKSPTVAVATGSCRFPMPTAGGTHEFRLFANGSFTRLAASLPITVAAAPRPAVRELAPTLSVSPPISAAGSMLTASWGGIAAPGDGDWIGLFTLEDPDTWFIPGAWLYVGSCSQVRSGARASGSCLFLLPGTLPPGSYELRLFAEGSYRRLAISPPFTVSAGATPFVRCLGPDARPNSAPGWRWTSEGIWFNDISGEICRPGDPVGVIPPPGPQSYTASFDSEPGAWHSAMLRGGAIVDMQWQPAGGQSGGYILSEGPWWLDDNHSPPGGAGDLHLVAFLASRDLLPNIHHHDIDFRNAIITLSLRGEGVDLQGSHLVFWMQSWPARGDKFVNYALIGQPLDAALASGEWTRVVLQLADAPSQWTCLGAEVSKAELYGCAALSDVLADVNHDFGFILFPVQGVDAGFVPSGKISIDEVSIQYQLRDRTPTGHASGAGVFRPSDGGLFLKSQNSTGFADALLTYGLPGDTPVAGDWTGKGFESIGVYREGTFYLRNSNTTGVADLTVPFGLPGDLPIIGDWNGDGVDTIGVYRDGTFYLRNSNTTGPPDLVATLGVPGDVPIAGDWTGKGFDSVGVSRPSDGALYLRNSNTTGSADIALTYGLPGDRPVVGDWNGDGTDTIGVYRNGQFLLRNSNALEVAEIEFALGVAGDVPIAGHWGPLPSPAPARGTTRGR